MVIEGVVRMMMHPVLAHPGRWRKNRVELWQRWASLPKVRLAAVFAASNTAWIVEQSWHFALLKEGLIGLSAIVDLILVLSLAGVIQWTERPPRLPLSEQER